MRVLVTGGAGFIGSNLIRSFIEKTEIELLVNVDCLTYAGNLKNIAEVSNHPRYCFEQVDIRDALALNAVFNKHRITHVIHLAAESHVDRSIASAEPFVSTNVLGTMNLLEACRKVWPANSLGNLFLHVSTDEVYGSLEGNGSFTEGSCYAPNSPYAASKAGSDMLVRAYHRTYGLPTVLTNSCNNFGPRQHAEKLIPVIIRSILGGSKIPIYGDGKNVRDWLFVEDHVAALWLILTGATPGSHYNIGASQTRTNLELTERICDLMEQLVPEHAVNARRLISFVADRPGHDRRYAIDGSKIMRELGWSPKVTFDEALERTVRWYLEQFFPR